ncbi:MAG: nickel import ATP-binding protein NikD [Actinobacteria bacterium]|nr:MAG: nickel import ATP-binding protein NikD [Actinomycetota bacterium]HIE61240.1 ABC transporter ATP-binding protein [Microbacterium sp.]|tara:strand:- start:3637 stop:4425 length:789 start_codon:yes stop_codon:yes gene_type:complete
MSLLSIENLHITFAGASAPAVDGVNIQVAPGQRVGIIGESGSGKSVAAMSVLRLNDERIMQYGPDAHVWFDGTDMLAADDKTLGRTRGAAISMIFQDPMSVLNPVFRVGRQVLDVLRTHSDLSPAEARAVVLQSFDEVGIRDGERVYDQYPHELSGGMRQRVMIAMAIAASPRLLIADEATSALDVTVQAAVLDTLDRLAEERGMAVLMITHDMGVVARFCDVVTVMYRGAVVEQGPTAEILTNPRHDYTRGLLAAVPRLRA